MSHSSAINFPAALRFLAAQNSVPIGGATHTGELLTILDTANVLDRANITGFEDLISFSFSFLFLFFNNDFDMKTRGVDVFLSGPLEFIDLGDTDDTLALNDTETSVENAGPTISPVCLRQLE